MVRYRGNGEALTYRKKPSRYVHIGAERTENRGRETPLIGNWGRVAKK